MPESCEQSIYSRVNQLLMGPVSFGIGWLKNNKSFGVVVGVFSSKCSNRILLR